MTVNDNMTALARAVLAGNGPAVFGLIDEVLAAADGGPSRDWLELWDRAAVKWLERIVIGSPAPSAAKVADYASNVADAFMAERSQRLAARAARKE